MKAELISINKDLLNGKVEDKNMSFLAKELTSLGIDVMKSTFVKDSPETLKQTLQQSEEYADVIVLVGGLGPDEDDITKQTLSEYLDLPLVLDQPTEDKIITFHKNSNFVMPDSNQLQALILQDSLPIRNVTGLAVGLFLTKNNRTYILLPGPFDELQPTYLEHAKPLIIEKLLNNAYIETRILRLFGLSEVQLTQKLDDYLNSNQLPLVRFYPIGEELEIQISIIDEDKTKAIEKADLLKDEVFELVKGYVFSEKSQTLLATVKEMLKEKDLKITAAESLTGGELLSALSSLSEASEIFEGGMVTYSEEVKNQNLGVTKKTIEEFGVVSSQCAIEMAEKVMQKFNADIGVSLTGVAGPSSLEGEIPGTVWIGIAKEGMDTFAKKYHFAYKRNRNRSLSVHTALDLVRKVLLDEQLEDRVFMDETTKEKTEKQEQQ